MAATSSGYVVAAATPGNMFNRLMDTAMFDIFNVTSATVAVVTTTGRPPGGHTQISPSDEQPTVVVSAKPTEEDYVVLPGPEDVLLFNSSNGLYQQSVTLTARMYPIEATAAKSIWGLPTLIWGILIGTIVILIVILATLFFCCWLQPRTRKLLSASYYATNTGSNVSHSSIVPKSQTSDSNQLVMPLSIGICPPQYSAPPPPGSSGSGSGNNSGTSNQQQHPHQQQQICSAGSSSGIPCHGSNVSPAAVHHSGNKYGSSPHQQQQYAHQQQYLQQQQYQHHHQCIHHQQQQQQYQAHYAHLQQQQQQHQQQQQSYQQYYNQQQQQHQQQQQQQQQLTQYIHPAQQQALQQQQREHQIQQQQQQHHYHHHQQQQQQQQKQQKQQSQLVHHKSMWAINPLYASSGVISDGGSSGGGGGGGGGGPDGRDGDEEAGSTSYRTRSLPSWGKNKQRPLSNADDLEELYAKVNFSKKRRNRMRNDEAAIIALCRSRSQNLAALPGLGADQDAVVVYDERTAL